MEQLRGLSQEGYWWIVRDGSRTVRELRTQNQQLHQALQQSATTTAESATKSHPSFVRFATVSCANSGISSVGRSTSSTSQSNLGGYEGSEKASTVEEHGE